MKDATMAGEKVGDEFSVKVRIWLNGEEWLITCPVQANFGHLLASLSLPKDNQVLLRLNPERRLLEMLPRENEGFLVTLDPALLERSWKPSKDVKGPPKELQVKVGDSDLIQESHHPIAEVVAETKKLKRRVALMGGMSGFATAVVLMVLVAWIKPIIYHTDKAVGRVHSAIRDDVRPLVTNIRVEICLTRDHQLKLLNRGDRIQIKNAWAQYDNKSVEAQLESSTDKRVPICDIKCGDYVKFLIDFGSLVSPSNDTPIQIFATVKRHGQKWQRLSWQVQIGVVDDAWGVRYIPDEVPRIQPEEAGE